MLIEKRSSRRLMNQINVVPYIDVMLVLLVIFMITAPMVNPGQVELPSMSKTSNPPVAPMEVSVYQDRTLGLRDRSGAGNERKVSRDELVAAVLAKQKANPDQAVVISADKDVRYAEVLEVMDMLQKNNVPKVGLLAKPHGQ